MGFIPDIERIFGLTPFTRQTLFFSATMAPEIERITNTFLSNPARVEVARQATASETIEQGVVMFRGSRRDREASEKRNVLRKLIDAEGDKCTNAIIFCNRKTDVDIVAKSLKKYGYDAAPIHGDLDQSQRTRTLESFRAGDLRFLVASDVAARGLDVPSVSHVFNFDVPSHAEDYVHRIGRTGRAGRDGKAMMICAPRDEKNFDAIEKLIQKEIPRIDNPLGTAPSDEGDNAKADSAEGDKPKPRRTRSRRGKSDSARDTARDTADAAPAEASEAVETKSDAPAVAATEAEAVTVTVEATPAKSADSDDKPRSRSRSRRGKPAEPAEDNASDTREPRESRENRENRDRSRGGQSRGQRGGGQQGKGPVGMGDHLPSFIALSFEERMTG